MKNKFKKMLPIFLIIAINFIVFVLSYDKITKNEKDRCWQFLNESANSATKEINIRMSDNINLLKFTANSIVQNHKLMPLEAIKENINKLQAITIFSRIDIITPDNLIYSQAGEVLELKDTSFEEIIKLGEHISTRKKDYDGEADVIYYVVPIKATEANEPLAALIGVIDCNKLSDYFKVSIYDGNAKLIITDMTDGKFIMDDWHKNLEDINSIGKRKLAKGYENINFLDDIVNGKTGTVAFISKTNGQITYLYYTPVGCFNWSLSVFIHENIAFSSLIYLRKIMLLIGAIEAILLLIYFLWNWYTINQLEKSKIETVKQLEISTTLIECVKELSANKNIDEAINNLLKIINNFFKGDRTYIFEFDNEKQLMNNTYEYANKNVTREMKNLSNIPLKNINKWLDSFKNNGYFYIDDLEKETKEQDPQVYADLSKQSIKNLIAVPINKNNKIIGFLGVDNPKDSHQDIALLLSIQFFVANSFMTKSRQEKLKYLSYNDMLTNLFNRNKYIHIIDSYSNTELDNIGIVYSDLNGLKKINDEEGHEAGDSFIKKAANAIKEIFPNNSYRIGGDEFVVLIIGIDKQNFEEKVEELKKLTNSQNISISFGVIWEEKCLNLKKLLKNCDRLMYEDKKNFYETNKFDRRKPNT